MHKLKIKKGDKVIVTAGKDKGFITDVIKVFPKENKAILANANMVYKHNKPSKDSDGGVTQKEMPINISNIAIVDPKNDKPTKVGFKFLENGKKVRFAKLSGELIDKV
ncbi:MAG: 50S ribosomal protein L24 [Rickettsiaceae bacterium]|nr:50S ribosomal protein L24 [Rickettsiaceae bacterium]